jgi:hypothetical protein
MKPDARPQSLHPWQNPGLARRVWPVGAWGAAALTIGLVDWFAARSVAALALLFLLPGWAWLEAGWPRLSQALWRLLLAAGLSVVLTGLGSLYLVYLHLPLTEWTMLGLCALLTLPALALAMRRRQPALEWPERRTWQALLAVLAVTTALRLPNLGYAEFREDEVEVTSLSARIINGEPYAIFLHRKGPLQILLPMDNWLLAGRINEAWARLPFAVAGILGVLALALLACQTAGPAAGVTTGLLLALNGYLAVFGRAVQYQPLVLLLASLGLVGLWQLLQAGDRRLAWPAMLCMGGSLLAHYDALLFLPVAAYLAWRIWRRWPGARPALLGAGLLAGGAVLSFYVPYLLDPQFRNTQSYLVGSRVGTRGLYNNLDATYALDRIYSSRLYQPGLMLLGAAALIGFWPRLRRVWPLVALAGAGLLIAWWRPGWLQLGSLSLAVIPWLLLTITAGIALGRPAAGVTESGVLTTGAGQLFWVWWAVPALVYACLVADPRSHVYVADLGGALLGGLGLAVLWRRAGRARWLLAGLGGAAAAVVFGYQAVILLSSETRLAELRAAWPGSTVRAIWGDLPTPDNYWGYPARIGWKGAGWLMATGQVPDDFRSVGASYSVPTWYSFETPRSCFNDPLLRLVGGPLTGGGGGADPTAGPEGGYRPLATITSEGRPRLALLSREATGSPATYDLSDLEPAFDALATPAQFAKALEPAIPLDLQFGQMARLTGFGMHLPPGRAAARQLAPGEAVSLRLYWLSLTGTQRVYRAFVHLGENPVWAQQDDDPACRLPTPLWRAGQTTIGQFRIVVPPQLPPGHYPLVVGLYAAEDGQRLPVQTAGGQPLGDSCVLVTLEVVAR